MLWCKHEPHHILEHNNDKLYWDRAVIDFKPNNYGQKNTLVYY